MNAPSEEEARAGLEAWLTWQTAEAGTVLTWSPKAAPRPAQVRVYAPRVLDSEGRLLGIGVIDGRGNFRVLQQYEAAFEGSE